MSDEELKNNWQTRFSNVSVEIDLAHMGNELDNRIKKFERTVKRRNNREIITAFALIPIFAFVALYAQNLLSRIGAGLFILFALVVITVLSTVRKSGLGLVSFPVVEYLGAYKGYLIRERGLLDKVLYWYISPAVLSYSLIVIGFHRYLLLIPIFTMATLVYILNKRAVRGYCDPLIQKVNSDLEQIKNG